LLNYPALVYTNISHAIALRRRCFHPRPYWSISTYFTYTHASATRR